MFKDNSVKMSGMQFNKPRFDWEAKGRLSELEQFQQKCNVLFQGPLSEMKDPQKAGFIVNWIGRQCTMMLHGMNVSLDKPETVFETLKTYSGQRITRLSVDSNLEVSNNVNHKAVMPILCGPELGHTSAVCLATFLVPHSPHPIPRGW